MIHCCLSLTRHVIYLTFYLTLYIVFDILNSLTNFSKAFGPDQRALQRWIDRNRMWLQKSKRICKSNSNAMLMFATVLFSILFLRHIAPHPKILLLNGIENGPFRIDIVLFNIFELMVWVSKEEKKKYKKKGPMSWSFSFEQICGCAKAAILVTSRYDKWVERAKQLIVLN